MPLNMIITLMKEKENVNIIIKKQTLSPLSKLIISSILNKIVNLHSLNFINCKNVK